MLALINSPLKKNLTFYIQKERARLITVVPTYHLYIENLIVSRLHATIYCKHAVIIYKSQTGEKSLYTNTNLFPIKHIIIYIKTLY